MNGKIKVLICPLNWGLGHATRDVPVIKSLLKNDFEVIIAANGNSEIFLKQEFPQLKTIKFPGYSVRYSRLNTQLIKMFFLVPNILFWSIKEHRILKKIIKRNNIDIVISDNRYGCWNRYTHNVFITHQLKVKFPGIFKILEPVYQFLSENFIRKYHDCWIPDYSGEENLSGELAHSKTCLRNVSFIGPLSRFEGEHNHNFNSTFDVLFILSGPEPQRSILEKIIYRQTKNSRLKCVLVRGSNQLCQNHFSFPVYDMLNTNDLYDLMMQSELIISRSGYSSIMDIISLKKKAVLVPTPGQTEQEYLARYCYQKGLFYFMSQQDFDLEESIQRAFNTVSFARDKTKLLDKKIEQLKEIKLPV